MFNYYLFPLAVWAFSLSLAGSPGEHTITPDLSKISDGKTWSLINASTELTTENGQHVVKLKPLGLSTTPSDIGLAIVENLEFSESTLEIDLKGKGKQLASFLGLAFNVGDAHTFEAVYFRPFNFMRDDPTSRAHAVQYVAWPEHTWEKLRKATPGKYEAVIKPVPEPGGWFHARIEITRLQVKVYVDEAKEPCLVVERLASQPKGKVGLWVDSKEGTFRNLKITAAK